MPNSFHESRTLRHSTAYSHLELATVDMTYSILYIYMYVHAHIKVAAYGMPLHVINLKILSGSSLINYLPNFGEEAGEFAK